MAASEIFRTRLLSSKRSFNKYIFYDQNFLFLRNEYIFQEDLYFTCNTNIFCVKIYFWNEIYIVYTFIYIFLYFSLFFSKKHFHYKTFFLQKHFFSANNVCFVKNTNIFSKKNNFFFQLSFATNEQLYSCSYKIVLIKKECTTSRWG